MNYKKEDEKIIIELQGKIDSSNSREIDKELSEIIEANKDLVPCIDMDKLEYISSAGLRVLMKIGKKLEEKLSIINASSEVYEILNVTGFTNIFDVKKAFRKISIEGCPIIGEGGNGKVYRLDDESIVKVYFGERNNLEKIRTNQENTRDAFLNGIPTAITFDIVKVGENYGLVYEMINAKSLMQILAEHPEKAEYYGERIGEELIKLHNTEFEKGALPDAREMYRTDLAKVRDANFFSDEEYERVLEFINKIPERNTFIHQDFHPGNILLQNEEEIVLIDVEDSGLGHPILDLAGMYLVYVTAIKHGWSKQFNVDKKVFTTMWDIIIKKYFKTEDKKEIKEINKTLYGYSLLKYLRGIATSPTVPNYLRKIVFNSSKKKLFKMLDKLEPIPK